VAEGRSEVEIAAIMSRVHSRDTEPERLLRKALWRKGLRYRTSVRALPGCPDIVLVGRRLAIFVDGDFWHGNQWSRRGLASLEEQFKNCSNASYWVRKIKSNSKRDFASTQLLTRSGWKVLRFWESDVRSNLRGCVNLVMKTLSQNCDPDSLSIAPEATVAEFFAGIGLMRLALDRHGWQTVFANDIDKKKLDIYAQNFSTDSFRLEDINQLRGDDIPSVTFATASFPCNDLSLAGKCKGLSGEHSGTFWSFTRIIREMGHRRPRIVLLENVPGFLNSRKGHDLADALTELNEIGYSCDLFTLNASSFVPQSRPRIFIVGVADDGTPRNGWHLVGETHVRPQRIMRFISQFSDIRWTIRRLPDPPKARPRLTACLEDLPRDAPEWWSRARTDYLMSQLSDLHEPIARKMIAGAEYSYGTVFRRVRKNRSMAELRVDGMAGCLRTPRGGSGRQILLKAGKGEYHVRLITPRECARLQGVPDSFRIDVPLNQALFGFGDAVCVPVIEWILDHYVSPVVRDLLRGKPLRMASECVGG
jgi:DNA (cytosine-5)-methyltransferase 1